MKGRLAFICLPAAVLALTSFGAAAAAAPIGLKDFRTLVRIASPQFSPDGRQIAFVSLRSDFIHDRYDATLRVISTEGGEPVLWSRTSATSTCRGGRPMGGPWLSSARSATGRPRSIPCRPRAVRPPIGDAPNGVEQYAWSPDGSTIAYVTPDDSPLSAKDQRTHHDLFTIHDDDYLVDKPAVPSHIWLLAVRTGNARSSSRGSPSVLETAPPISGGVSEPSWSADGQWLVYDQQADANDSDSDRSYESRRECATGREHPITSQRTYEYAPRFAPKGNEVAYLYLHGPGAISDNDLFVGSPEGNAARDVSADLDRNVAADFAWLPDASGVVVMADDHVGSKLYLQPLRGHGHALNLGTLNPLEVTSSSAGSLAVVADGATQAPELYFLRTPASAPVRLTNSNSALAGFAYPQSVEVQWHAPDGQQNDGILTYPNGYQPGKRYPLVVYSHGGPEAASSEDFDVPEIGPLRDLFAARGFLVFEPNYRGSDNLGTAHEHAIYRDPGAGPDGDVISGIRMLEGRGIVDSSRIAAVGHSYGGYMTGWLISHQHFWRCAVVADGALDWTEEYELSGAGNLAWTRDSLGGGPWDKQSAALYRTGSPMTYAGDITTPTLILSGTDDTTVPITESFALYHALSSRGIAAKFIGIPGAHHSPQDPVHTELLLPCNRRLGGGELGSR